MAFKVGDVCRVRYLSDIEDEYGRDVSGYTRPQGTPFVERMEYMSGEIFTVSDIEMVNGIERYRSLEGVENQLGVNGCGYYYITEGMLELADNNIILYSQEEIESMIS